MKRAILFGLIVCTPLIGGEPGGQLETHLSWLGGSWKGKMWGGDFTARYTNPVDDMMFGYSELERDGRVVLYEFERFWACETGIVYTPYPRGKQKETFRLRGLAQQGKRKVVFENGKKDFPTRISFAREGDVLTITLSEIKGDKRQVFTLKRTGADGK